MIYYNDSNIIHAINIANFNIIVVNDIILLVAYIHRIYIILKTTINLILI